MHEFSSQSRRLCPSDRSPNRSPNRSQNRSAQEGAISLIMGFTVLVMAGMAALAVDVGYMNFKRGTMQNAADLAALAGAASMPAHGNDFPAIRAVAEYYAAKNLTPDDAPEVAVQDEDITFYLEGVPNEDTPDQIEVVITRSEDRGNPLVLFLGGIVGTPLADISASARAGLIGVCSSKCVKPFIIPTKFDWDDTCEDPSSEFYENGQYDPTSSCETASMDVQGYTDADVGTRITVKPGEPQLTVVPGQYNLVDLPPVNKGDPITGASMVHENIIGCTGSNSQTTITPGDELLLEPGNTAGPVTKGVTAVMNDDPTAYFDEATDSIQGSVYDNPMDSPRVAIMAFYDPLQPPVSGRNSIFVYQLGAMFIESVDSKGNVSGRFIHAVAEDPSSSETGDCMLKMTRLILDSGRM